MAEHFDLAVVGAGIVGWATALAAVKRGLRVIVIDRDNQANGASVRNFGFITVTGQERGAMWARARRSRDVWCEVAAAADIAILHTGLWMTARRGAIGGGAGSFSRHGDGRRLQPAEPGGGPASLSAACRAGLESGARKHHRTARRVARRGDSAPGGLACRAPRGHSSCAMPRLAR